MYMSANNRYGTNIILCFQRKEYVRYAKVFPLSEVLDFKLPSKWYRRAVGGLEIVFGLALALLPSRKYIIILADLRSSVYVILFVA